MDKRKNIILSDMKVIELYNRLTYLFLFREVDEISKNKIILDCEVVINVSKR